MQQKLIEVLEHIDKYLGGSQWFVFLLLGTGILFTLYLGFPQIRYFRHAFQIVRGKFDKQGDKGDTTHFQALTTALSGTVGTGNIGGVALAIYLGGPAALFWMLVTAFLGMTTKFVEVLLSHKYREFDSAGQVAGGPMYYMKHRLNIKLKNGKLIKTGYVMGGIFAFATILSSFGTGNLPQINNIAISIEETFGLNPFITGGVLAILLGLVIIGGIKRIAKVTSKLVPGMAILYFVGAIAVLVVNYTNIWPSLESIFSNVFTGSAAAGGFLGASFRYTFNKGVARGLFSNEAGQGSAPIAHAAARAHEPVSEGMVAILEPFFDTIIICFITGLTILSSGVWTEKFENRFDETSTYFISGQLSDKNKPDIPKLHDLINDKDNSLLYTGVVDIEQGIINSDVTVISSRSVAEDVRVYTGMDSLYTGNLHIIDGLINNDVNEEHEDIYLSGLSLLHSAPLTTKAFMRGFKGGWGQYIVSIGLLLFAFSTAISWSYYGDRAVTYLWGTKYVLYYRIAYVAGFFIAAFANTNVIWAISYVTIALMAIPNLIGILVLSPEVKRTIKEYWIDFKENFGSPD
ncbi:MAG: sodium:alanine symporter family protein [Bacteroidales bacterium]|nr:sodium:alanine symporter family protein [Bacteroidales bacterium]MBN2818124.1 sodium:alanine symporter family protein [Bacteroidales bacterium]